MRVNKRRRPPVWPWCLAAAGWFAGCWQGGGPTWLFFAVGLLVGGFAGAITSMCLELD